MIKLNSEHYLAEGITKKCYNHPENSLMVIKLIKSGSSINQKKRYTKRLKREIKVLKIIHKNIYLKKYFPKYLGEVKTNLGDGYIFEKINNYFDLYKSNNTISKKIYKEIINLVRLLIKYNISICADLARNIFITYGNEKIYILDGVGNKHFIALTMKWFPKFIRKYFLLRIIKKHIVPNLKEIRKKVR